MVTSRAGHPPIARPASKPGEVTPALNRRRLGNDLRRMREARSLRLEDVAARLDVAASTLSRIETGKAPTRTSYLHTLLDFYEVSDPQLRRDLTDMARAGQRKEWWRYYDDLLPPALGIYLGMEAAATTVRSYSLHTIPDLLQTEDYATAVCRATRPGLTSNQVSRLAAMTLRRQELLHDDRRQIHLVIDEAALLRQVGSPSTMTRQLSHLVDATTNRRVTIQVASLGTTQPVLSGPFTILSFADKDDPDIGFYHSGSGHDVLATRAAELGAIQRTFAKLTRGALPPASSVDRIKRLARRRFDRE